MKREININKKMIIMLLLINILVIAFGSSYALFQTSILKDNVIRLQAGNTNIITTIDSYIDNLITLASGETKTLNITLSNITDYDILYQMYYTVESGIGTITTTELSSAPKGTMNNTKTLAITIQNNNVSEITIKVATKGALINSSITLESNEYQFITDTTPPTITVSIASSTAGTNNWYSAISFKGVATDDKTMVSTISSCITTSTTCIPDSSTNASEKTVAITGSNTSARRVCFNATDTAGNTSDTVCSSAYLVDQTIPTVSNILNEGNGKITFTVNDSHSGVYQYCVNSSSNSTTNCTWYSASNGSLTTENIISSSDNYYVHVKDNAGNIRHSSKITIIIGLTVKFDFGTLTGLTAINTAGTVYDGTGTIREYRYSGAIANNYIKFNNGEMWRIVGVFKNDSGEWNLKLMRNTVLTSTELPSTYNYGEKSFKIKYGTENKAYWYNYDSSSERNFNDWTTTSLQYYLNGTDGYFGTLTSGAQALVDTGYTYYLGNVWFLYSPAETSISSYEKERNTSNIWYGNKAMWNGAIALLYPSDYGYSVSSSYWSSPTLYNFETGPRNTSWMYKTSNHSYNEWLVSPSGTSTNAVYVTSWTTEGNVREAHPGSVYHVRPVLNLLSTAQIDANHTGSSSDPYVVIGS